MNRLRSLRLGYALVAAVAVASCVLAPDQRHYADGLVLVAPPQPQVEVLGPPPVPGYLWIGGYWAWVGDRYRWTPGRWVPPRPGHHWVAAEWVRQGDGWRLRPGRWRRD